MKNGLSHTRHQATFEEQRLLFEDLVELSTRRLWDLKESLVVDFSMAESYGISARRAVVGFGRLCLAGSAQIRKVLEGFRGLLATPF